MNFANDVLGQRREREREKELMIYYTNNSGYLKSLIFVKVYQSCWLEPKLILEKTNKKFKD